MAQEEDLFVIFRPGPYICAEWDFGGLPRLVGNFFLIPSTQYYIFEIYHFHNVKPCMPMTLIVLHEILLAQYHIM